MEFTKEKIEEITKLAAKIGAESAFDKINFEKQRDLKITSDKRLKNTKMLLQNYRDFKEFSTNAIFSSQQADEIIDIIDLMWDPNNRSEQVVDAIKKSAVRTNIIMTHIDTMINVYKKIVEKSNNEVERRRFRTLESKYISENALSIEEIAKNEHVEVRTSYMDLDNAINKMSKLLFGIDFLLSTKWH